MIINYSSAKNIFNEQKTQGLMKLFKKLKDNLRGVMGFFYLLPANN